MNNSMTEANKLFEMSNEPEYGVNFVLSTLKTFKEDIPFQNSIKLLVSHML